MLNDAVSDIGIAVSPPVSMAAPAGSFGGAMLEGVAPMADAEEAPRNEHDHASRRVLLSRVAALLDVPLLPPTGLDEALGRSVLLVPADTVERPRGASPVAPERLLGGVVPAMFIGTKAIAHGLVDPAAQCPPEWSPLMAELTAGHVLRGYTAFNAADALEAGRRLLGHGPVRLKDVCGKAGLGQAVVRDETELLAALALEDAVALARCGLVLEQDLTDVVTYSVGVTELGGERVSYWGQQNLTRDHQGREVYGGSDLFLVRGGLDALLGRGLPPSLADAVRVATAFDEAALRAYPDAVLTRRNYDVIEGHDARGERQVGVLEQSWRIGGASGAEIAAFEAFRAEPGLGSVRCSTVEIYDRVVPPAGATVYYHGEDPVVGALTKFAVRLD